MNVTALTDLRRTNITSKLLDDLRSRIFRTIQTLKMPSTLLTPSGPIDLKDNFVLGPSEPLEAGVRCAHCSSRMREGYLSPGFGYICEGCAVLLLVRGLVVKLDALQAVVDQETSILRSIATPDEKSSAQESGGRNTFDPSIPGETGPADEEEYNVSVVPGDLAPDDETTALEVVQEPAAIATPPYDPWKKPDVYNFKDLPPGTNINKLPPGTVVKFPIKERKRFDGTEFEGTSADSSIFATSATIHKKAGYHEHVNPEVDMSTLSDKERSIFDGYQPGTIRIENASDVYAYERACGDPELMRLLSEEDDEEMKAGEDELARAAEERRGGRPAMQRNASGAAGVRTFDPEIRAQREAGESTPAKPSPAGRFVLPPLED